MTQYVSVQFNPWDRRSYTYHNDGPDLAIGDLVEVGTIKGKQTVRVVSIIPSKPELSTKPIIRVLPPEVGAP
jgi:hypothetical protein